MFLAMGALAWCVIVELGGLSKVIASWSEIDGYLNLFNTDYSAPCRLLVALSWIGAGIFVIAQPHIMVRFFAVKDMRALSQSRIYYYIGFTLFYTL